MNVTVLGAGAWGTALSKLLLKNQHAVTLWGHNPVCLDEIRRTGCNDRYLPGIQLPSEIKIRKRFVPGDSAGAEV